MNQPQSPKDLGGGELFKPRMPWTQTLIFLTWITALPLRTSLQVVAVRIHSTSIITVCCLYLPPNADIRQQDLNNLVDQLPAPFVILSDFNRHSTLWGSVKTNPRGRQIEQVLSDHCLCLLNYEEPMYFHESTRSFHTLDLAICSPSLLHILNCSVEKDLYNSDHFPVVLSHDCDASEKIFPPTTSYNREDWALFTRLAVISDAMFKTDSVDIAVQKVTNVLIAAADLKISKRIRVIHSNVTNLGGMLIVRQRIRTSEVMGNLSQPGKVATDPLSYRHIVLTSCFCKTFERMVNTRLMYVLEKEKRISSLQSRFLYGSARASVLKRLDTIHHSALRIISGAFRTSPVTSLYVVCHQPSLELRRRQLSTNYFIYAMSVPSHTLKPFSLATGLTRLYDTRSCNINPFSERAKAVLNDAHLSNTNIQENNILAFPPWDIQIFNYSNPFSGYDKAVTADVIYQQLFSFNRSKNSKYIPVNTDGSMTEGHVGCGVVFNNTILNFTLHNSMSVFSVELTVILIALQHILVSNHRHFCAYTDSMSALDSLHFLTERRHPTVMEILILLKN
ncbi:RNase H domain-containing protein [Trichonephila clavipes]|nr:RNase H domain-containing protein [Trichonephila clavipes]